MKKASHYYFGISLFRSSRSWGVPTAQVVSVLLYRLLEIQGNFPIFWFRGQVIVLGLFVIKCHMRTSATSCLQWVWQSIDVTFVVLLELGICWIQEGNSDKKTHYFMQLSDEFGSLGDSCSSLLTLLVSWFCDPCPLTYLSCWKHIQIVHPDDSQCISECFIASWWPFRT